MQLKFPFKFVCDGENNFVYTAHFTTSDIIKVSWNIDGEAHSVNYLYHEVCAGIQKGTWVVIEEQDTDPLVEIHQSEYDTMVEQINLLQELLAEANSKINTFKSIKDMTRDDWVTAMFEGHEFKTRNDTIVRVTGLDEDSRWCVRANEGWYRVDGSFDYNKDPLDIIERVK